MSVLPTLKDLRIESSPEIANSNIGCDNEGDEKINSSGGCNKGLDNERSDSVEKLDNDLDSDPDLCDSNSEHDESSDTDAPTDGRNANCQKNEDASNRLDRDRDFSGERNQVASNGRGWDRDSSGGSSHNEETNPGAGRMLRNGGNRAVGKIRGRFYDLFVGRSNGAGNGRDRDRDFSGERNQGASNGRGRDRDSSGGNSHNEETYSGGGRMLRSGGNRDTGNIRGRFYDLSVGRSNGAGNGRRRDRDSSGGRNQGASNGRDRDRDLSGGSSHNEETNPGGGRMLRSGGNRDTGNIRGRFHDLSDGRNNSAGYGRGRGYVSTGRRNQDAAKERGGGHNSNEGLDRRRRGADYRQKSTYDATLYNFFDGTRYLRSHGYNDVVRYTIKGHQKILPKTVVKLLELIFDKTSINRFINQNTPKNPVSNTLNPVTSAAAAILNNLLWMEDAQTIMKECENDPNKVFQYYLKLNTKIRPLEHDSDEFKKISNYVKISHGPTHSNYRLEVMEIFKISRRGEFKKYKKFKNEIKFKKLLWHGSRLANYATILSKGLQIAPNHAKKTGSMFGEGIYFADTVTKSSNYCGADKNNPIGVVLLAEVAIGNTYKKTQSESVTELPSDKNSVKAYGKCQPDPKGHIYTKSGVQVPMGKPKRVEVNSCLQYNEYIVFNPDQILLQYLIQLKFIYK